VKTVCPMIGLVSSSPELPVHESPFEPVTVQLPGWVFDVLQIIRVVPPSFTVVGDALIEIAAGGDDSSLSFGLYVAGLVGSLQQPGSSASILPSPSLSMPSLHSGAGTTTMMRLPPQLLLSFSSAIRPVETGG